MKTLVLALFLALQADRNAELKTLDFIIGEWVVDVEARLGMEGGWDNSKAKSVIKHGLENSLIEEEFIGTRSGKPFLSKTLLAYDHNNKKFQRVFIDGPHGVLLLFEGGAENDLWVFDKNHKLPDGSTVILRTAYKKLSADSFTVESMRMPDGTTEWDVTGRMKYTRVK
jgi:hypothetical protein